MAEERGIDLRTGAYDVFDLIYPDTIIDAKLNQSTTPGGKKER